MPDTRSARDSAACRRTVYGVTSRRTQSGLFPTYLQDPAILTCPNDPFRFRMLETKGNFTVPDDVDADATKPSVKSELT